MFFDNSFRFPWRDTSPQAANPRRQIRQRPPTPVASSQPPGTTARGSFFCQGWCGRSSPVPTPGTTARGVRNLPPLPLSPVYSPCPGRSASHSRARPARDRARTLRWEQRWPPHALRCGGKFLLRRLASREQETLASATGKAQSQCVHAGRSQHEPDSQGLPALLHARKGR